MLSTLQRQQDAEPNPKYFGVAKGKNVIYLHLESMQNFLINYKLNGEEVTPFLNSLASSKILCISIIFSMK